MYSWHLWDKKQIFGWIGRLYVTHVKIQEFQEILVFYKN